MQKHTEHTFCETSLQVSQYLLLQSDHLLWSRDGNKTVVILQKRKKFLTSLRDCRKRKRLSVDEWSKLSFSLRILSQNLRLGQEAHWIDWRETKVRGLLSGFPFCPTGRDPHGVATHTVMQRKGALAEGQSLSFYSSCRLPLHEVEGIQRPSCTLCRQDLSCSFWEAGLIGENRRRLGRVEKAGREGRSWGEEKRREKQFYHMLQPSA